MRLRLLCLLRWDSHWACAHLPCGLLVIQRRFYPHTDCPVLTSQSYPKGRTTQCPERTRGVKKSYDTVTPGNLHNYKYSAITVSVKIQLVSTEEILLNSCIY